MVIVDIEFAELRQCAVGVVVDFGNRKIVGCCRRIDQEFGDVQRTPFASVANTSIHDRGLREVEINTIKVDCVRVHSTTRQPWVGSVDCVIDIPVARIKAATFEPKIKTDVAAGGICLMDLDSEYIVSDV